MNTPALGDFRRIIVKVGSSLLVDAKAGAIKESWLASLTADLASLHRDKRDILVVSSGAIVLGRAVLKLASGPLKLEDSQAAAAVGQIALGRTWTESLSRHCITAGQVLVTPGDTE
jgi:glutamate 5-kinase